MAKKKNTIKDQIQEAKKQMEALLHPEEDIVEIIKTEKVKKTKRKTVKEQYKEIKESLQPKVVQESKDEDYEQFLINSLFKGEERSIEDDSNQSTPIESKPVKEKTGLWDYTLEDEIKFFDPECSYELTGYIPISETESLDFDPVPFMETGRIYTETGAYCEYPIGSKPYNDFWDEQLRRCSEGYKIGKYRLTGDHYFFLNFYRMNIVDDTKKSASGDTEGFPKFLVEQYKFFHYFEMCEYLKRDVVALKSRGISCATI